MNDDCGAWCYIMKDRGQLYVIYPCAREGEFMLFLKKKKKKDFEVNVLSIIHHVELDSFKPIKILLRVGLFQNL